VVAPTRRWLFADQLGPHWLPDDRQPALLIESTNVLRRRRFHRQKAHLVLSALRHSSPPKPLVARPPRWSTASRT
jgi:deoxyribodipyrimidine photolyase-like uncharacterized protein